MNEKKEAFCVEDVDRNLATAVTVTEPDLVWLNVRRAPFSVHGLLYDEDMGRFLRVPQAVANEVSEGVAGGLNRQTAGGRVRFRTDSRFIAICAVMENTKPMRHMPLTGQSGFDLYHTVEGRETYYKTFVPKHGMTEGYDAGHDVDGVLTAKVGENAATTEQIAAAMLTLTEMELGEDQSLEVSDDLTTVVYKYAKDASATWTISTGKVEIDN